jgi:tRNA pseudouridine55 synthase
MIYNDVHMDGILSINKPEGMTSYGVVARVRRLSGERRVGHAGTLDPAATGVLPVCLGKATRVVEFIMGTPKTYLAGVELGITTDTYDAAGRIVSRADASSIDRPAVEAALGPFRGDISQTPPMYSAVKQGGRPLYALAREGLTVTRQIRKVAIHRLELVGWQPPRFTLEVTCGRGTYIRSLAHDLGQALGCGAHLATLARTRYGPFDIQTAVPLPRIEEAFQSGDWRQFLYPVDFVLQDYPAAVVDEEQATAMSAGKILALPDISPGDSELCRAYSRDGRFLGILRRLPETGKWHPDKVFIS